MPVEIKAKHHKLVQRELKNRRSFKPVLYTWRSNAQTQLSHASFQHIDCLLSPSNKSATKL